MEDTILCIRIVKAGRTKGHLCIYDVSIDYDQCSLNGTWFSKVPITHNTKAFHIINI